MTEFLVPVSWDGCDHRVHTRKDQGLPHSECCTVAGRCYFYRWKANSEKRWELLVVTGCSDRDLNPAASPQMLRSHCSLLYPESLPVNTVVFSKFLHALLPFCPGRFLCALFTLFIVKHASVMVVSVGSPPPWPRPICCAPVSGSLTFCRRHPRDSLRWLTSRQSASPAAWWNHEYMLQEHCSEDEQWLQMFMKMMTDFPAKKMNHTVCCWCSPLSPSCGTSSIDLSWKEQWATMDKMF